MIKIELRDEDNDSIIDEKSIKSIPESYDDYRNNVKGLFDKLKGKPFNSLFLIEGERNSVENSDDYDQWKNKVNNSTLIIVYFDTSDQEKVEEEEIKNENKIQKEENEGNLKNEEKEDKENLKNEEIENMEKLYEENEDDEEPDLIGELGIRDKDIKIDTKEFFEGTDNNILKFNNIEDEKLEIEKIKNNTILKIDNNYEKNNNTLLKIYDENLNDLNEIISSDNDIIVNNVINSMSGCVNGFNNILEPIYNEFAKKVNDTVNSYKFLKNFENDIKSKIFDNNENIYVPNITKNKLKFINNKIEKKINISQINCFNCFYVENIIVKNESNESFRNKDFYWHKNPDLSDIDFSISNENNNSIEKVMKDIYPEIIGTFQPGSEIKLKLCLSIKNPKIKLYKIYLDLYSKTEGDNLTSENGLSIEVFVVK